MQLVRWLVVLSRDGAAVRVSTWVSTHVCQNLVGLLRQRLEDAQAILATLQDASNGRLHVLVRSLPAWSCLVPPSLSAWLCVCVCGCVWLCVRERSASSKRSSTRWWMQLSGPRQASLARQRKCCAPTKPSCMVCWTA